jgi:hypothetical protein
MAIHFILARSTSGFSQRERTPIMSRFLPVALLALLPLTAQAREELVKLDYRSAELRQVNGRWIMYSGAVPLKDLGTAENEAREALRIVRDLRFTQHGTIGTNQPIIEYWLTDGRAPQGLTHSLRLMAFHPDRLRVDEVQGQWCLCDGGQVMFGFGPHAEDARQTLAVLQHYGFNRVGYVGVPTPVMMYFLNSDDPESMQRPSTTPPPAPAKPLPLALLLPSYQLHVPDQAQTDAEQAKTRLRFDWQQAEISPEGREWKLTASGRSLASFASQQEALDALHVVQFYRFTEQCRAGQSAAACTYYLVNGEAPHGLMLGLRNIPFQPESLAVRQQGNVWVVSDRGQAVICAGNSYEEASQALEAIRRYQFDHACLLGSSDRPSMSFLVRDY